MPTSDVTCILEAVALQTPYPSQYVLTLMEHARLFDIVSVLKDIA
jgi:hypothetical protein